MHKYSLFTLLAILFISSCSGPKTALTASTKVTDHEAVEYTKLAVIVLVPNTSVRANLEEAIATELRTRGVKAISTFTIFPLASHMEEVRKNSDATEEEIENNIREKINSREIDGILIITLLDARKEQRYVQKGMSLAVAGPSVEYADPVYNYEFTDYYSYTYASIYKPGYYETSETFFVESNLYDMSNEQLEYTAQFNVKDPDKLGKDSEEFARILVDDMLRKKVLEE